MEQACFAENEIRFRQTEHTPPMSEPMISELGFLGDTEQCEDILNGRYSPPRSTDPYMIELLTELRMPQRVRTSLEAHNGIITQISQEEENRSGWKKRCITSAEASGLTMDHYVVGSGDDNLNEVDTLFQQLPYQHGLSPDSWKVLTDVEILKKPAFMTSSSCAPFNSCMGNLTWITRNLAVMSWHSQNKTKPWHQNSLEVGRTTNKSWQH
jgi:hypothetical protein